MINDLFEPPPTCWQLVRVCWRIMPAAVCLAVAVVLVLIALVLAGCAMAVGDRSTVCVDINSRTGLVIDPAASAAAGGERRVEEPAGINCRSGG